MIDLHYCATPNGEKITMFLEEAELPYHAISYDLIKGEHLTAEYRAINPNYKLPAIIDHAPLFGSEPLPVFESGAILLYLAEKCEKFLAASGRERSLAQQWLVWQTAGLGPMTGQAMHFVRYAPEIQDYPITRYTREVERLLHVLEFRLRQAQFVAESYSIADMAIWPWIRALDLIDISLEPFPAVSAWVTRIASREAVKRALGAPERATPAEYRQRRAVLTPEQWSNAFGDRMHAASRKM